jgi:alanyl-tRNA synthetase
MKSEEIRKKFFDFFIKNGHTKVPSSSLIPAQDPTILFTNAGMNQFKDAFLGKETRSYSRAVSIQKCMRAGGKHNDLDNVGFTKRHLTFFEMMGNFSFGDYFKKEAIQFAWDFLTGPMGFSQETFYASVYKKDDEAYALWRDMIGLPESHVVRLGEADNFWQMGDTGPCGPCTEIYIDRGAQFSCGQKTCAPGCSCDRFLEVWNLVFMQFDRQADGTDNALKRVGVDTGMGLERLCAIMQNKDSVFQTDLFEPIINRIEGITRREYQKQNDAIKAAFHVLADHIRASTFLIADGCAPSNEGRGYVLRKIIRRAALFSKKLTEEVIFPQLADIVIEQMASIYPELVTARNVVVAVLTSEVEKFSANLVHGQALLDDYFKKNASKKIVSGEQAFKLYDTYGFPLELTQIIAQEKGFTVDLGAFEKFMEKQREQSGRKVEYGSAIKLPEAIKTVFTGYEQLETLSTIAALVVGTDVVQKVKAGQECLVIPKETPFYVECGGQVSDQGFVQIKNSSIPVQGLQKIDGAIAFALTAPIDLVVGDSLMQSVNKTARLNTMKNHTATHLLQAALIELLGKQVKQAGSLVVPDYLRFDFTYHENLTSEQIKAVETIVNGKIQENIPVDIQQTTYKKAIEKGVIAFFGEKYNPEKVRVVSVPGFSAELCGGTHVRATGDIGCFKITEIAALSAGQRRIVAVTGPKAVEIFQESFSTVKTLSQEFKVQNNQVVDAVNKHRDHYKHAQTEVRKLKKQLLHLQLPALVDQVKMVGNVPLLIAHFEEYSGAELKEIAHELLRKKPALYVLLSATEQGAVFYTEAAQQFANELDFQALRTWLEKQGLRSGGKGTMLQGGGTLTVSKHAFDTELANWLKSRS